jgi:hypothetical protein
MPIPKPIVAGDKEIEYMSFADAHTLPFTNEHQPSLAVTALRAATRKKKASIREQLPSSRLRVFPSAMNITKLKNKSDFKIGVAAKVRGVVECNNCKKPRCIYSSSALSHIQPPLPPPRLRKYGISGTVQYCGKWALGNGDMGNGVLEGFWTLR